MLVAMIMCNLHFHLSVFTFNHHHYEGCHPLAPYLRNSLSHTKLEKFQCSNGKAEKKQKLCPEARFKTRYSPLIYLRPVCCGEKPSKDVFHKKLLTFVDPGCDPVKAVESKSGSDFLRKQLRCKVPSRSSVPALGHALVLGPGSSL